MPWDPPSSHSFGEQKIKEWISNSSCVVLDMGHALTQKVGLLLLACPVTGAWDKGHRSQLYHLASGLVSTQYDIVPLWQLLKCFEEFLTVPLGLDFFTTKQRECYSHSP